MTKGSDKPPKGTVWPEAKRCSDPECRFNKRGLIHSCGQCSGLSEVKCACWKANQKK